MRIEAEVKFTSWHVYSLIYTLNISQGGMNLELSEEPPVGAQLTLKLLPPKGEPVVLDAVVKHSLKNGKQFSVGVQFENVDKKKLEAIEKTIRAAGVLLAAPGLKPRTK
jgi:hypothetical protein